MDKDRAKFLREKLYELHLFLVKLLTTLASATLAFSIGIIGFYKDVRFEYECLLYLSWVSIIFSVILVMLALRSGLMVTYEFYNNLNSGKEEVTDETEKREVRIHMMLQISMATIIFGIILLMLFFGLNFQPTKQICDTPPCVQNEKNHT